jgi:hypothetical protein
MRKQTAIILFVLLGGMVFVCLIGVIVYQLPPVQERLAWRVDNLVADLRRLLNPPEQVVFIPSGKGQPGMATAASAANATVPPPSITRLPLATVAPEPDLPLPSPTQAPTPMPSPTPLPGNVLLSGIVHEYQQFNNCGPTNLAMALSYWGWQGDQRDTRRYLRPNLKVDDKNVMPSEMAAFVEQEAGMQAIVRVGGDLDTLRGLLAGGFPVLIEAGHHPPDDWWMGHYLVVNGYDDRQRMFTVQDSLTNPDLPMSYDELASHWWRDFNYVYLVIYPPERQAQIAGILGARWDEQYSFQMAAQKANDEIPLLPGRDQFFAWFNLGSSRVGLEDYTGAAQAYDEAFNIYQSLSEDQRPYRLMWYQIGPYQAYYNVGRYQDVIDLANTTFAWVGKPVLE